MGLFRRRSNGGGVASWAVGGEPPPEFTTRALAAFTQDAEAAQTELREQGSLSSVTRRQLQASYDRAVEAVALHPQRTELERQLAHRQAAISSMIQASQAGPRRTRGQPRY